MTGTSNPSILFGGAERDRTVGLLNAIQALSQLSYSPMQRIILLINTAGGKLQFQRKFCVEYGMEIV
jgi:hypothetical protein